MVVKLLEPMALMEFSYLFLLMTRYSLSKEGQMSLVSCLAEALCAY